MEEFINEGYLIKALDLPEEYADSILQPTFSEEYVKKEKEEQANKVIINPYFKPESERINPDAPITLHERIRQISHLSENVTRDCNELANLDRMPENILLRARGCLWLAMMYELFAIYEPESIVIPFLTRLTETNMQGFFCVC